MDDARILVYLVSCAQCVMNGAVQLINESEKREREGKRVFGSINVFLDLENYTKRVIMKKEFKYVFIRK